MRRYISVLLAMVLATLLTGCPVDQTKEVATYRSVLEAGADKPGPRPKPGEALTLEQSINQANYHNETLNLKGEDYLQMLIQKDRAFSAFIPTVHLTPSYLREEATQIPGVSDFAPSRVTDVPVTGALRTDIPHDISAIKYAEAGAERQRELLLDMQSTVFLDVARTYYQVLRSEAQVEVLKNSVEVQRTRLADTETKERAGFARPVDVAQAQAQLAGTQTALIAAQNDARNGRAVLALLTGLPSVEGPLVDHLSMPADIPDSEQLLTSAWEHRRDLAAAHKQVVAGTRLVQAAWSQYFPSISLNFTYFLSRQSFPDDVDWMGMVGVDVPIFSAGLIHDDVRTAWSRLRQAKLAESYLTRQIQKELRVTLADFEDSQKKIDELTVRKRASEDALKQSEFAYNAGVGTNLDRLVAQDQLLTSNLGLVSEELNRKIFYLNLVRMVGRLNPETTRAGLARALGEVKKKEKPAAAKAS